MCMCAKVQNGVHGSRWACGGSQYRSRDLWVLLWHVVRRAPRFHCFLPFVGRLIL